MKKTYKFIVCTVLATLLLTGCMRSAEQMYAAPKRLLEDNTLQQAVDAAMQDLAYFPPLNGENQAVQFADLNADGSLECVILAKGTNENLLQILLFENAGNAFQLIQTILCNGVAFDQVHFADLDGITGDEMVVGTSLHESLDRNCMVYTFAPALEAELLVSTQYKELNLVDLDGDSCQELFVIKTGKENTGGGAVSYINLKDNRTADFVSTDLSVPCEQVEEVICGAIWDGIPAVFVVSAAEDMTLLTDVFVADGEKLLNLSYSDTTRGTANATHSSASPQDMNGDDALDLPYLMPMMPMENMVSSTEQELIRWYSLSADAQEITVGFTFHNYVDGWYISLDSDWASYLTVVKQDNALIFYLWDENYEYAEKVMTVSKEMLDADSKADFCEPFLLSPDESVVFSVVLEDTAADFNITEEFVNNSFHFILK